jgi:hypothetical protein
MKLPLSTTHESHIDSFTFKPVTTVRVEDCDTDPSVTATLRYSNKAYRAITDEQRDAVAAAVANTLKKTLTSLL